LNSSKAEAMSTPLITRVGLKIKKIAREWKETPAEREWRQIWALVDSIEGWLYPSEGKWLFDAARSLPKDSTIVEIGSFKGRSTCCLAFGSREGNKRIFAIDSFDGGPGLPRAHSFPDFSQNLQRCGLSKYVEPIVGMSGDVAKTWGKPIHFLFIDGSHAYEDVLADFAGFFPYVVPGGVVAFHDVNENWPGVLKAWNEDIEHQLIETGNCEGLGYGRKPGLGDSKSL
jgi:predicted O-methyltransferase YrrM